MNIALLNLDFATEDSLSGLAGILRRDNVCAHTYHEQSSPSATIEAIQPLIRSLHGEHPGEGRSLLAVAPGFATLKLVHDLCKEELEHGSTNLELGISLPEAWMIRALQKSDHFRFEAFYTYLSSCLSLGYERMRLSCATAACADYFSSAMLGGFVPPVRTLDQLCNELRMPRRVPAGLF